MTEIINIEEIRLAKMAPNELLGTLMALPAPERLELILARSDAKEIVQALPEQDFYLFVKELQGSAAHPLLALAKVEQINHILDLEVWTKDQIQGGKALAWIEEILKASDQTFLEWLYHVDSELLIVLFKKWLDVAILSGDAEIADMPDDYPQKTIDDQFYYEVRYPQYEGMIKSVLNFLFDTHYVFYRDLLTQVVYSLDSEQEEFAYHFHQGRLADNAIPDSSEATVIYYPLKSAQMMGRQFDKAQGGDDVTAPSFAMMCVADKDLLTEVLALIDDPRIRRTLQIEFASLANKIVVADGLASYDPDNLGLAANKAAAYVNLGLDTECHGELSRAVTLLSTAFVEDLFRVGHGAVKMVTKEIETISNTGWLSRWPHGLNCLDLQWQERVSLLLDKTPMLIRQGDLGEQGKEDFIRNRADLGEISQIKVTIGALGLVFTDLESVNGGDWGSFAASLWRNGQHNSLHSVTLSNLMLTAIARKIWSQEWDLSPLPVTKWPEILPYLSPDAIEDAIAQQLRELFPGNLECTLVQAYFASITQNYRDEIGNFSGDFLPEAQLIPFFLFMEPENDKKNT